VGTFEILTLLADDLIKQLIIESITKIVLTFLGTLPILVAAILSYLQSRRNTDGIEVVRTDVNSKMDSALKTERKLGNVEGQLSQLEKSNGG